MRTFAFRHSDCGCPTTAAGLRLLDAGCGTGASTAALLSVAPHADIVAIDASKRHARRGEEQVVAPVRPIRAHARRRPRRERRRRAVRRDPGRVPDPQPGRSRHPVTRAAQPAGARRHPGGARLFGARLPARHRDLERGVLGHHHSLRLAADPRHDAVSAFVAQRADFRRRNTIAATDARRGFRGGAQRNHAGLGNQHRAHLPRGRAVDRPAPPHLPGTAGPAQRRGAVVAAAGRRRRRRHRGPCRRDGSGRTRHRRRRHRTRGVSGRAGRRLDRAGRRRRAGHEPRLPRLLPAVLQPARAAAPRRPDAVDADRRSTTTR